MWLRVMMLLAVVCLGLNIAFLFSTINGASAIGPSATAGKPMGHEDVLISEADHEHYKAACPDYRHYSAFPQYVCLRSILHLASDLVSFCSVP